MSNVIQLSTRTRTVSMGALAPKPAKPERLTQAKVKAELRAIGCVFRKTDWNEFRVNIAGNPEETASYESDLESALDSGRAMVAHLERTRKAMPTTNTPEKPKTVYRLGSTDFCYAPGIVRYARQMYKFPRDRQQGIKLLAEGWNIPREVSIAICEGAGKIDGETFVIEV
jgi:hypothetical protein